jgi:hypothetical protein
MSTMTSSFRFRMVGPSRSFSRVWLLTPACSDPLDAKLCPAEDALSYRGWLGLWTFSGSFSNDTSRGGHVGSHSQIGCDRKDRQCC